MSQHVGQKAEEGCNHLLRRAVKGAAAPPRSLTSDAAAVAVHRGHPLGVAALPMPMPRVLSVRDDDELDELPPIDGDAGDSPDATTDLDDEIGPPREGDAGGESGLDDATAEGNPPDLSELDGDEAESGWLEEAADSPDLDLGEGVSLDWLQLREETVSLEDGEEPPSADEDFGIGEGEGASLESAEDGPLDADEQLREEDLPAMDADDEGENDAKVEETALLDDRFVGDEPLGLPWAAEPWARVGPPADLSWVGLAGGVTAIACASRGALVAGRSESGDHVLMQVDLEGARHVLPGDGLDGGRVGAIAVEGDAIAAVSEGGRVWLSRNRGARFECLPVMDGVAAADVAVAFGVVWVRTRTGSLLAARPGKAIERCLVPGLVVAIANDGSRGMRGLAVDDGGLPATLLRGTADGSVLCEAVQTPDGRPSSLLATRGDHVAYVSSTPKSVLVRRGPEGGWRRFVWDGRVSAITFVDDDGTLLAATYSEGDDTTGLVRLDALGRAALIARLGAARDDADADGRVVAISCDDPRGVVWVAGGFGVAAFAIR
jgi:hypothetical protein